MDYELSHELIDQIIFGMENQAERVLFDSERGELVPEKELEKPIDRDRYIELPEWNSLLGYQLMERFVHTLRNPIVRESLRDALSRGKGVFRNFKNVLRERSDIERLWFSFKEREMKTVVIDWYNELCEMKGFERMSLEPEDETDVDELVLTDFDIKSTDTADANMIELLRGMDRRGFQEVYPHLPSDYTEHLFRSAREGQDVSDRDSSFVFHAENPAGEVAGFIWGVDEPAGTAGPPEEAGPGVGPYAFEVYSTIKQLYITEAYRGLGLSKALLHEYLKRANERAVKRVFISLPANSAGLQDYLVTQGFSVISQTFELDMHHWYEVS
jgi:GNAT superfamily N-acetyltransferase